MTAIVSPPVVSSSPSSPISGEEHVLFHNIGGIWTDSLLIPPCASSASHVYDGKELIIIPGNPGVHGFYTPFAHDLSTFTGRRYPVRVITWPGFSNRFIDGHIGGGHKRYYTLEEHVQWFLQWLDTLAHERHQRYLRQHHGDDTRMVRPRFILLGHSIGAWLCVQALARRPAAGEPRLYDIDHAALLTPFVRRDIPLPIVAAFRVLFALRPIVKLLIWFAAILPRSVKFALLKLATDIRAQHALDVCADTFMSRLYWHGIELGKDEFDVLPTSTNYKQVRVPYTAHCGVPLTHQSYGRVLEGISDRLSWYYAARVHDTWAPLSQFHSLKPLLPLSRWHLMPTIGHAWPAYINESKALAASCAAEIMHQIWKDDTLTHDAPTSTSTPIPPSSSSLSSVVATVTPSSISSRL